MCLYASYTAVLTSSLTVSNTAPPFTSLKEALLDEEWRVGVLGGAASAGLVKVSCML